MATKKTTAQKAASKKATAKKAAAKKTAAKKQAASTELVVMDNEDKDILAGISQDLNNSDIGQFYRARACVALVLLKARCPHGLYESTTAEAMPNRSSRSLRRYYGEGKQFLDANNLTAVDAYAQLRNFDPVKALAQGADGRLLIGTGADDNPVEIPQAVEALANKINEKIEEKKHLEGETKKEKRLTKSQKREAAVSDLMGALARVNVALSGDWRLVDTETLETVAATFTLAAATLKEELKARS
jgi:hypothetical protein